MKSIYKFLAVAAISSLAMGQAKPAPAAPAPAAAQDAKPAAPKLKPTDPVLWVGDEAVSMEQLEAVMKLVPGGSTMPKKAFAEQYGMLLGLSRIAEKEKVDQTQEFKDQMAFQRMQTLAQMAFAKISVHAPASEAEVEKYFKEHAAEFQQLKVRGIYVAFVPPGHEEKPRTDEQAREVAMGLRKKVIDGAPFADVAKASSEEQATAAKGGDFGLIRKGQLPPNIEKAVYALKVKEVSEPVKTAQGYYLFMVDEVRSLTLDEGTPQIRSALEQNSIGRTMDGIKKQYPVKYNEDYFTPPAAPATTPAKP